MTFFNAHAISIVLFLPLLGVIAQAFSNRGMSRWWAFGFSLLASLATFLLVGSLETGTADLQYYESYSWIGTYGIRYEMGIDGMNVLPVLLIGILFPILISSEWNQSRAPKGLHSLLLISQSLLFGAVCAQDLFLQFFLLTSSVLPFYFLVGIWGRSGRETASLHSLAGIAVGDALIFSALLLIYYALDPHTFSLNDLAGGKFSRLRFEIFGASLSAGWVTFCLICAGFCLRGPIWPFHGWLVEMVEQAPASVSAALCGIVVPATLSIFVRDVYLLFPEIFKVAQPWIVGAGILNLVVASICAFAQTDLRRLMAYLCLSEIGLVLVGIGCLNSEGLVGAVFQTLIFGIALGGFGLSIGKIAEHFGSAEFQNETSARALRGVFSKAPWVAAIVGVVSASLSGFPGLAGFVGHALVLIGGYSNAPLIVLSLIAAMLLVSQCLYKMFRIVFLGEAGLGIGTFQDLSGREKAFLLPLAFILLVLGVYPKPFIELIQPTVITFLSMVK